ncbi:hypothetical protein [Streptomyces sp. NPDC055299]
MHQRKVALAGAAHLELVSGIVQLRPEDAMFDATLRGIVRASGIISRVGVPQYEEAPVGLGSLFGKNAQLAGGPAPVRAYLEPAVADVLAGRIDPGRVFDAEVALDQIADAYKAMDERSRLKVLVRP